MYILSGLLTAAEHTSTLAHAYVTNTDSANYFLCPVFICYISGPAATAPSFAPAPVPLFPIHFKTCRVRHSIERQRRCAQCSQVKDDAPASGTGSLPAQAARYCGKQSMEVHLKRQKPLKWLSRREFHPETLVAMKPKTRWGTARGGCQETWRGDQRHTHPRHSCQPRGGCSRDGSGVADPKL